MKKVTGCLVRIKRCDYRIAQYKAEMESPLPQHAKDFYKQCYMDEVEKMKWLKIEYAQLLLVHLKQSLA